MSTDHLATNGDPRSPRGVWQLVGAAAVIGLIAGIVFTAWGCVNLMNAWRTSLWPHTEEVVTGSQLTVSSVPGERGQVYGHAIQYQYSISGVSYTASRVSYKDVLSNNRDRIQNVLDEFAVGLSVPVYYNPDDHSDAVLKPGIGIGEWLFAVIGIAMIGIAIVFLGLKRALWSLDK